MRPAWRRVDAVVIQKINSAALWRGVDKAITAPARDLRFRRARDVVAAIRGLGESERTRAGGIRGICGAPCRAARSLQAAAHPLGHSLG